MRCILLQQSCIHFDPNKNSKEKSHEFHSRRPCQNKPNNKKKKKKNKKKKKERTIETIKDSQESMWIRCKLNERKKKKEKNEETNVETCNTPHDNRSPVSSFHPRGSDKRKAGESPDGSMGRRPLEMKLKLAELLGHFAPVKGSVSLVCLSPLFDRHGPTSLSLSP